MIYIFIALYAFVALKMYELYSTYNFDEYYEKYDKKDIRVSKKTLKIVCDLMIIVFSIFWPCLIIPMIQFHYKKKKEKLNGRTGSDEDKD